jgi:hypothetical protein
VPPRLGFAERQTDDVGVVLPGRVHRHLAPATTDIEQARYGSLVETELSADKIMLDVLCRLEGIAQVHKAPECVIAGPSTSR